MRDARGNEAAFQYPMSNVTLKDYDKFVSQMQDTKGLLPAVDDLRLSIGQPLADAQATHGYWISNSITSPYEWEKHAREHDMDVEEMKWMYFFAREQLYRRFKSRLRTPKEARPDQ